MPSVKIIIKHRSPMQTDKSQPSGQRIMPETSKPRNPQPRFQHNPLTRGLGFLGLHLLPRFRHYPLIRGLGFLGLHLLPRFRHYPLTRGLGFLGLHLLPRFRHYPLTRGLWFIGLHLLPRFRHFPLTLGLGFLGLYRRLMLDSIYLLNCCSENIHLHWKLMLFVIVCKQTVTYGLSLYK